MGPTTDKKDSIAFRFDPIGFEIDKFFRCTKHSYTGIISCGQNLFDKLKTEREYNRMADNGFIDRFQIPYGNDYSTFYDYFNCIFKKISKEELKGIDEDYKIYYLYNKDLLPSKMRNEKFTSYYRDTIALIKEYDEL